MSNINHKRIEFPQAQFALHFIVTLINFTEPMEVSVPVTSAQNMIDTMKNFFDSNYKDLPFKKDINAKDVISAVFTGLSFADTAVAEGKIWANLTDKQEGNLELSQYNPSLIDAQAQLDKILAILGIKS
jgi:hypothetical protein